MSKYSIGIDEVGRGPIAGPVTVGAFVCSIVNLNKIILSGPTKLKDSKKLNKTQRELWSAHLYKEKKKGNCDFIIASKSASAIDKKGISVCIKELIQSSLLKLENKGYKKNTLVLLDGGLYAPDIYKNQKTIIKGDEKEPLIAMASIVAKVYRDKYMAKIALKYPGYGLEKHVGYGTRDHYKALKNKGITALHRKSYLKKLLD